MSKAIEMKLTSEETIAIMKYTSVLREVGKVVKSESDSFMESLFQIMKIVNSKPEDFSEECLGKIQAKAGNAFNKWDFARCQAIQARKKKAKAVKTA